MIHSLSSYSLWAPQAQLLLKDNAAQFSTVAITAGDGQTTQWDRCVLKNNTAQIAVSMGMRKHDCDH